MTLQEATFRSGLATRWIRDENIIYIYYIDPKVGLMAMTRASIMEHPLVKMVCFQNYSSQLARVQTIWQRPTLEKPRQQNEPTKDWESWCMSTFGLHCNWVDCCWLCRQRGWQGSVTSERASESVSQWEALHSPSNLRPHTFCSVQKSAWTGNVAELLSCVSASV